MSFKIVQTIERGVPYLSIVPMHWEMDGVLYWPKRDLYTLRENAASLPDLVEWRPIPCTVKRRGIRSFIEAQRIEGEMSRESDTEGDIHNLPKKRRKNESNRSNASNEDDDDYNSLFMTLKQKDTHSTPTAISTQNTLPSIQEDSIQLEEPAAEQPVVVADNVPMVLIEAQVLFDLVKKVNEMDDTLKWLKKNVGEMKVINERFISTAMACTQNNRHEECPPIIPNPEHDKYLSITDKLKIDSTNKLENLESQLANPQYSQLFVEYMSHICGTSGKKEIKKCRYLIFDHIFDRKFIVNCTWTGSSHGKAQLNFSKNVFIVENIFKIFKLACADVEKSDMKEICTAIFNNSTSRMKNEVGKVKPPNEDSSYLESEGDAG